MLDFVIKHQSVERRDEFAVVSESRNYLTARFEFSDEWANPVVLFGYGDEYYCVCPDEDNCCIVPAEVIKPPFFTVSAFCGDEIFVTSDMIKVEVKKSGFTHGKKPQEPTPELWQQYVTAMENLIAKGLPHIGENGNWFLYSESEKDFTDTGIRAEGYVPVRGVDYWTDADRADITEAVLAAMPDADTMKFPLDNPISEVTEE